MKTQVNYIESSIYKRERKEKVMKKILDLITDEVTKAFTECGFDAIYA